jgi:DNA-directed RNA polymerase subunit RPC12/RpoP
MQPKTPADPAKVTCPKCESRLMVVETQSGGRLVAIAVLGTSVEDTAVALETFAPPGTGRQIACPACRHSFDPSGPYRPIPPLSRRQNRV